jgi:undecaprenyl-diphosphatase
MIDQLIELDKELFFFLNDLHTSWLDTPMMLFSNTLTWTPLYILLIYLIVKDFPNEWWIILLGIAASILLSDQITSSLMKPFFERLRPSRDPALEGLVHYVDDYRGGLYGFASSHAANTFGTATFLFFLFHKKRKGIFILFFWAALVTYTRIYLGVHYPGDIIVGGIAGAICATFCYYLTNYLKNRWRGEPMQANIKQ